MSEFNMKEVRFDLWCQKCVYLDIDDTTCGEPCNECLTESARQHTSRPLKYVPKYGNSDSN